MKSHWWSRSNALNIQPIAAGERRTTKSSFVLTVLTHITAYLVHTPDRAEGEVEDASHTEQVDDHG